jgi:hypothetical protein
MSQSNMFLSEFYKSFENGPITSNLITPPIDKSTFGILNVNAVPCNATVQEQEFVFVIDRSGSMSDKCSDGRTKMQHINHTLKNMILYFYENPTINLHIIVFAFDDSFVSVIERTRIHNGNLQSILTKIDVIQPRGGTNIELALNKTNNYISKMKTYNPTHNISHIFMTDGDATTGISDHNVLKGLVLPDIENFFIGFGLNHDSSLLTHISSYKKSSYHFIDALEKAGLVYGEILHGILYKHLTEVEISVKNGFVYNYKDNLWVNKLFIGDIVGEANKTYHLISNTPESCTIILTCENLGEEYSFGACELMNPLSNHLKYIYRQKTLEMLFEVNQLQKNKMELETIYGAPFVYRTCEAEYSSKMKNILEEERELKQMLRAFFEEIKKYMLDNNLNEDKILKNLCDDIYITYRTLGTRYGAMYTCARQTSQGNQRSYTVSNAPEDNDLDGYGFTPINYHSVHRRQTSGFHYLGGLDESNDDDITLQLPEDLQHNVSSFDEAPYLTPCANRVMRDVSSSRDYY